MTTNELIKQLKIGTKIDVGGKEYKNSSTYYLVANPNATKTTVNISLKWSQKITITDFFVSGDFVGMSKSFITHFRNQ